MTSLFLMKSSFLKISFLGIKSEILLKFELPNVVFDTVMVDISFITSL